MSDYLPITIKPSKFGLKAGGKATDLIDFIRANTNERGYFNFEILQKKEPGKYGDTHYAKVDTWQPKSSSDDSTSIPF